MTDRPPPPGICRSDIPDEQIATDGIGLCDMVSEGLYRWRQRMSNGVLLVTTDRDFWVGRARHRVLYAAQEPRFHTGGPVDY